MKIITNSDNFHNHDGIRKMFRFNEASICHIEKTFLNRWNLSDTNGYTSGNIHINET